MIIGRALIPIAARTQLFSYTQPQLLKQKQKQDLSLFLLACTFSTRHVSKNIEHILQDSQTRPHNGVLETFNNNENRPLLVILSWLLPKRRHIMKFVNLYLEQGFDAAIVSISPWQLMWPTRGSRLVAGDLIEFLIQHQNYQQILLHGFSVGGYMWGEVLDLMKSDRQKCYNIIDRIVGQVWDSAADVTELSIGTTRAIFPKNEMLRYILGKYFEYHLKTFYEPSTQYYIRSSQLFHTNLVRCPALFFVSKTDQVGSVRSNLRVKEQWDTLGVKTYIKIFEKSPHVGHYWKYPKEYVAKLYAFLHELHLIQNEEKMRAHF